MHEYEFRFSVNLAKVVAAVGTMLDELHRHMDDFGFPEQLSVRSDIIGVRMTCDQALTADDKVAVANIMLVALREKFPTFEVAYEGCQSYPTLGVAGDELSHT
jgi:hypothetical protein